MKYEKLKLKNQLCHPLYTATNALVRVYDPYLTEIDLTYPQYLIMMALWERDHVSITYLSAETLFDSGSLTPLLQRLKKKGFIEVKSSKEDLRQKVVVVSKKGEKLKLAAAKIPELMFCRTGLTLKEVETLRKLLLKMRGSFDETAPDA